VPPPHSEKDFDAASKEECVTAVPPTASATATLAQAREHARSLAGATAPTQPTIPASAAANLPASVLPSDVLWDETVGVGGYASRRVPRGSIVRFEDPDGDACVSLMVYNARHLAERLNVADTVKVQWQAYLGAGSLLLSDMGRVLVSIIADSSERHDALCGVTNRTTNQQRYGDGSIESPTPAGRELLAVAAAKWGLARRDLAPPMNLFKGVRVLDDGGLEFDGGLVPATTVMLRAEMDVVLILANAPHPLDGRVHYQGSTVRCLAWRSTTAGEVDLATTPERQRAFENTADHLMGLG
jgi:urea carboxylase-associated protein 2